MAVEQLLGGLPTADFMKNHFLKLPFAMTGGAKAFADLGSWETLGRLLADPAADVHLARQGVGLAGERPRTAAAARQLFDDGYTVLVRHAEQCDPGIRALAESFRGDFAAPVDIHLFCTPATKHGFGWHYDAEDLFILQTSGVKQYSLRKNTVNPWPTVETLPADMAYEREIMPIMDCRLAAGDWLYIPAGYWHVANAVEESISLSVGVMTRSAIEVLDFLRERLLHSLRWRQRLPPTGSLSGSPPDELGEQYQTLFAELAEDVRRLLLDERFVRDFLSSKA